MCYLNANPGFFATLLQFRRCFFGYLTIDFSVDAITL